MSGFRGFLWHFCLVCSFVQIIAKVIDWHNPYMDFSGCLFWMQVLMCVGVNLLFLTGKHKKLHGKK